VIFLLLKITFGTTYPWEIYKTWDNDTIPVSGVLLEDELYEWETNDYSLEPGHYWVIFEVFPNHDEASPNNDTEYWFDVYET
jgi:hypothetical protein